MDIITLIQLPLHIRQRNHHRQIPPHIALPQLQRLAHLVRRTQLCSPDFPSFHSQYTLALEAVEILREPAIVDFEVVALHEKGEEGIELIEGVEGTEEVAWVAVGGDGEEVAEGGGDERGELLFAEEFKKGGFEFI